MVFLGHNFENHAQANAYLLHFVQNINMRKASFLSKLMMLNNFMIDFFLVSHTVVVIKTLIPKFGDRWHCKSPHRVARNCFTIPRYLLYGLSSNRLEVKRVGGIRNISGNLVLYIIANIESNIYCSVLGLK